MESKRFSLNWEDIKRVSLNILIFIAPDLIIFFEALEHKFNVEGAFLIVLGINILIDLLKKFLEGRK